MPQQAAQKPAEPAPSPEAAPASIGILLDNSGSMKDKRKVAVAALKELVKASNPRDEFFVVNFNQSPYMDVNYTSNQQAIFRALDLATAKGPTSMNDALIAAAEHFHKGAKYKKKMIVLLTDGVDNSSRMSFRQVLEELHKPDMPAVYCIGLSYRGKTAPQRNELDLLAQETGGKAFYPGNEAQLNESARQIAHEIDKIGN
jgi:Ca-activated chloride channel homolog